MGSLKAESSVIAVRPTTHPSQATNQIRIRVYADLEQLRDLRPAWENLLQAFPEATAFSTWEWLAPWWRSFGAGQQLLGVGFFDSTETLAGLALLSLAKERFPGGQRLRVIRMMGAGSHDSDNLDFPVRPGYEFAVAESLREFLESQKEHWDLCELYTLPQNSLVGTGLQEVLRHCGWPCFVDPIPSSFIQLPETWDGYMRQLSSRERSKIRYRQQKLEKRYQLYFHKCTDSRELPARLAMLFELHEKRWRLRGERGSFASASRRQFYAEMADAFLERGWLQFWFLELNGKPVASQYGFRYGQTVFALQVGFDPAYSTESVGYVLSAFVLKRLIEEGVRRYDFLAGQDSSKDRWGTQAGQYVDLRFARPFTRGGAYLQLVQAASSGKAWLRERIPPATLEWIRKTRRGLRGQFAALPNDFTDLEP